MPRWQFLSLDLFNVTLEFQPGAPRKVRCFKLTYEGGRGTMKPATDDCLRKLLADYVPDDDDAQEESDDEDGSDDGKDESGGEVIEDDRMLFPDHGAQEDSGEDVDAGGDEDTARFSAARTMSSGRRMHSVPSVCS